MLLHSCGSGAMKQQGSCQRQACKLCRGITWMTKEGLKQPNFWGSITQSATVRLGNFRGEEVFTPLKSLLPMVAPEDLVLGGWDISSMNLADAMQRAQVSLGCVAIRERCVAAAGTQLGSHAAFFPSACCGAGAAAVAEQLAYSH